MTPSLSKNQKHRFIEVSAVISQLSSKCQWEVRLDCDGYENMRAQVARCWCVRIVTPVSTLARDGNAGRHGQTKCTGRAYPMIPSRFFCPFSTIRRETTVEFAFRALDTAADHDRVTGLADQSQRLPQPVFYSVNKIHQIPFRLLSPFDRAGSRSNGSVNLSGVFRRRKFGRTWWCEWVKSGVEKADHVGCYSRLLRPLSSFRFSSQREKFRHSRLTVSMIYFIENSMFWFRFQHLEKGEGKMYMRILQSVDESELFISECIAAHAEKYLLYFRCSENNRWQLKDMNI